MLRADIVNGPGYAVGDLELLREGYGFRKIRKWARRQGAGRQRDRDAAPGPQRAGHFPTSRRRCDFVHRGRMSAHRASATRPTHELGAGRARARRCADRALDQERRRGRRDLRDRRKIRGARLPSDATAAPPRRLSADDAPPARDGEHDRRLIAPRRAGGDRGGRAGAAAAAVHGGARGAARIDARASSAKELAPHVRRVGGGARVPDGEPFAPLRRARVPRAQVPAELGGQGGDYAARRRLGARSSRAAAGGGRRRRDSARTPGSRLPPIWKFGTEEQHQRWLVPGIRGEQVGRSASPSPTPAPTSPRSAPRARSASTAASSSTAPRRSSPTGCAPTSSSPPCKTTRGGRPPRHLVPVARREMRGLRGRRQAREDGLARLRHGATLLHRRRGARGEPARRARTRASS